MRHPLIDELIRSNRRSIGLQVSHKDGSLLVRAPRRAHIKDINAFVASKESWILKVQAKVRERLAKNPVHEYRAGEQFLYLGEKFELVIVEAQHPPLTFNEKFYLDRRARDAGEGEVLFERWYKKQARPYLSQRLAELADKYSLRYNKFKLSGAKGRWGSCSTAGNINLTWRLIKLDPEVIDYVIIHELAHLKHHNHSKAFWNEVEKMLPEYKTLRKNLRNR